MANLFSISPE